MCLLIAILDVVAAVFNGLNAVTKATEKKPNKNKAAIGYYSAMCALNLLFAAVLFGICMNK